MYEIWLILNTFYELALANLGLVVSVLVVWLALMVLAAIKKQKKWCAGIKPAVLVAIPVWILFFIMVPSWTKSSHSNVTYIVDYLVLAGTALGFAALAAVFVWPLYLVVRR